MYENGNNYEDLLQFNNDHHFETVEWINFFYKLNLYNICRPLFTYSVSLKKPFRRKRLETKKSAEMKVATILKRFFWNALIS